MLCGLRPTPPEDKCLGETAPGFEKVVDFVVSDAQSGMLPVQPEDKTRVWGVVLFSQQLAPGGKVRREIAEQCGRRDPGAPLYGKGANSGLRLVATDPDAALTALGSGTAE